LRGPRRIAFQRFDTYIVISMPKRKSTAVGVSHFMVKSSAKNGGPECAAEADDPLRLHDAVRGRPLNTAPDFHESRAGPRC
jgi:hypothetical protein